MFKLASSFFGVIVDKQVYRKNDQYYLWNSNAHATASQFSLEERLNLIEFTIGEYDWL